MFKTIRDAFKIKEIRNGLIFTFLMLIVVRLGSLVPTPGVDVSKLENFFSNNLGDGANSLLNSFTGGSFQKMSIFALSVTPYITSSIIIQLLTIAIPALEEMQKDGNDGRKKITAITRIVSVALAIIEGIGLAVGFGRSGLLFEYNFLSVAVIVITLTAGSTFVMWLGERITEKGIGNGVSIILLINIVSRMPNDFVNLKKLDRLYTAGYKATFVNASSGLGITAEKIVVSDYSGMASVYTNNQGFVEEVRVILLDNDREFAIINKAGKSSVPNLNTVIITNPKTVKPGDKVG